MTIQHSYHTETEEHFAKTAPSHFAATPVADNNAELLCNIIGESEAIKKVRFLISTHAKYDAPVLITGETGTGKELAARGLHYCGSRHTNPSIAVNCATLTDELFASEVFGHVTGSFTDVKRDKKGFFDLAEKGTLFLDEVDSLSLKSQAALLRFLQEGEYRPVGAESDIKADVRLIASANCNLEEKIRKGEFRADLYYRLYILSVHMPSLRERISDIPLLINYFIEQFDYKYALGVKRVDCRLLDNFLQREWPGNIRELENLIHRLYLCSNGSTIDESTPGVLSIDTLFNNNKDESSVRLNDEPLSKIEICNDENISVDDDYNFSRDKKAAVERFEQRYVKQVMEQAQGNVTLAAKLCGKERRAFGKLVKKYNIKKTSIDFDVAY